MKFNIFRSANGSEGGPVDPTEAPRMGGQVLPHAGTDRPADPPAAETRAERPCELWAFSTDSQ